MPAVATVVAAVCAVLAARLWTWSGRHLIKPRGDDHLDCHLRPSKQIRGTPAAYHHIAAPRHWSYALAKSILLDQQPCAVC